MRIEKEDLRKTTKEKYIYSLNSFLTNIYSNITDIEKIKSDEILNGLENIKDKSKVSSIANSLLRIKKYNKLIDIPEKKEFKKIIASKKVRRKNNTEIKNLDTILRKINVIRDKKLKLAYRLALVSGLRIFEVSALLKDDFKLDPEGIEVFIRDGKGGKSGLVKCLRDKYLEKELKEHLSQLNGSERVFYSDKHMKNKALSLKFQCHDLRRAFSKKLYQERKPIVGARMAKIEVQQALRHTKFNTTKIYLNSKINI
jgi:integrase